MIASVPGRDSLARELLIAAVDAMANPDDDEFHAAVERFTRRVHELRTEPDADLAETLITVALLAASLVLRGSESIEDAWLAAMTVLCPSEQSDAG